MSPKSVEERPLFDGLESQMGKSLNKAEYNRAGYKFIEQIRQQDQRKNLMKI